jgi:uncharacterized protein (DUF1810 family)
MDDVFKLSRFIEPQKRVMDDVRRELSQGYKQSHWMWFVFPQLQGLGNSPLSKKFGLSGLDEAKAYLAHPVLSKNLLECTSLMLDVQDKTAKEILGSPDDMKFRSSMTLFDLAGGGRTFAKALEKFYGGRRDKRTLEMLDASSPRKKKAG